MSPPTLEAPPNDPQTAQVLARVKRLMVIAGLTTSLGVGAILVVIGYRLFRSDGSGATADITATLPKGARVVSTAASADQLLVTLEIAGATEVRSFDARTLKPLGRLRFSSEP